MLNLITSVSDQIEPIVLFPEDGVGVELFRERGIRCLVIPFPVLYSLPDNSLFSEWMHPWRWSFIRKIRLELTCIIKILIVLNHTKIDIVHTNTSPASIGVLLSRVLHAKHIWHIRELLDLHYDCTIFGGIDRLRKQILTADGIIAISKAVATHWKLPQDRTYIMPNAVRKASECIIKTPKSKYILFLSYILTEQKGVLFAVDAFAQSKLQEEGYKLLLVGDILDEKLSAKITMMIAETQLYDSVVILPRQENVQTLFENASAFLMASRHEGLGRVTAEAMFFGCPVVAHASGGTLDIVKDGITGYLFSSVDDCTQKLRKACLTDQIHILKAAQRFAISHLSEEAYGPKIMKIYYDIMNKGNR